MATEHDKAVAKWGLLAAGDAASVSAYIAGVFFGAELEVAPFLIAAGAVGSVFALATVPVIAVMLCEAIAASNEQASRQDAELADAMALVSPSTLGLIGLTGLASPFIGTSPISGFKDPWIAQEFVGGLLDLGLGLAGAGTGYEQVLGLLAYGTTVPGTREGFRDLQQYFAQHSSTAGTASGGYSSGGPGGGSGAPGAPYPGAFASGGGVGLPGGDFYPFSPGLGDLGPGSMGEEGGGQASDGPSMSVTIPAPPSWGSQPGDGTSSGSGGTSTGTDPTGTGTDPTGTGTDPTGTGTDPTGTGTDPTGTGTDPTGTGTDPTGTGTNPTGTGTDPDSENFGSVTAPTTYRNGLRGPGLSLRSPSLH